MARRSAAATFRLHWCESMHHLRLQVDVLCQSRAGLRVVGYYHANESMTDVDLRPFARRLADRIQQQQKQAITLLVRHTA